MSGLHRSSDGAIRSGKFLYPAELPTTLHQSWLPVQIEAGLAGKAGRRHFMPLPTIDSPNVPTKTNRDRRVNTIVPYWNDGIDRDRQDNAIGSMPRSRSAGQCQRVNAIVPYWDGLVLIEIGII